MKTNKATGDIQNKKEEPANVQIHLSLSVGVKFNMVFCLCLSTKRACYIATKELLLLQELTAEATFVISSFF